MRRNPMGLMVAVVLIGVAPPLAAQDVGLALGSTPEAVQLEDLDGRPALLSQYVGKKPVLVEFWATWCGVCKALEPKLTAIRKQHGDALEILTVAVGVNQSPRSIRRFLQDHPLPGPIFFDARGRAARAFEAPATSYIVALDASGRVVYTGIGEEQDLALAVRKALGR